jgi:hypothetical protein
MIINSDSISEKSKKIIRESKIELYEKKMRSYRIYKIVMLTFVFLCVVTASVYTIIGKDSTTLWIIGSITFVNLMSIINEHGWTEDVMKISMNPSVVNEIKSEL